VTATIIWKEITTAFKGRAIAYAVEDGIVKVRTARGEKATHLGGTNAIWVAGACCANWRRKERRNKRKRRM
jgi:hypothetical protein